MRHGHSMWNANPSLPGKAWKYAGAVDIPLSTTGVTVCHGVWFVVVLVCSMHVCMYVCMYVRGCVQSFSSAQGVLTTNGIVRSISIVR
jgi:hypothetical protein